MPNRRRSTLSLHSEEQSEEELLLSQELLDELKVARGTFVEVRDAGGSSAGSAAADATSCEGSSPGGFGGGELCAGGVGGGMSQAGRAGEGPSRLGTLVLRIGESPPPRGHPAVSVLAQVASRFGFSARQQVELVPVSPADAALEWVEMIFRDQYLSRGDIWFDARYLLLYNYTIVSSGSRRDIW
jgi:hypothetical protein